MSNRIPADRVRSTDDAAVIASSTVEGSASAIAVAPIVDDNVIVGFEVRCGCGSQVIIDCEFDNPRAPTTAAGADS